MRNWLIRLLGGVPKLKYQSAMDIILRAERELKFEKEANEILRKHNSELQDRNLRAERIIQNISSLVNGD